MKLSERIKKSFLALDIKENDIVLQSILKGVIELEKKEKEYNKLKINYERAQQKTQNELIEALEERVRLSEENSYKAGRDIPDITKKNIQLLSKIKDGNV